MKLKLGSVVTDVSGKLGGQSYMRTANGWMVRNTSYPVQRNSQAQQLQKSRIAEQASAWRNLTEAQKTGWGEASFLFPQVSSVGNTYYLSGFTLFVKFNTNLAGIGQGQRSDAPYKTDWGIAAAVDTYVDFTAELFGIDVTTNNESLFGIILECTPALTASVSSPRDTFKSIARFSDSIFFSVNAFPYYMEIFPATRADLSQSFFLRITQINNETGETDLITTKQILTSLP